MPRLPSNTKPEPSRTAASTASGGALRRPGEPRTQSVAVPAPLSLRQALDESPSLALLGQRRQRSMACLQASLPALPEGLRAHVSAGPYDEQGWTLIAANAAVAAKLRQCLPAVRDALTQARLEAAAVRVHVKGA